jgi:dihydrofolate synthase/folylpolyglutamate synthase
MAQLEDRNPRPLFLVTGMLNTKDPVGYFHAFDGIARQVFTVPIRSSDAGIDEHELAEAAETAGLMAEPAAGIAEALEAIGERSRPGEPVRILIGGSLYVAGDALAQNGTPPE